MEDYFNSSYNFILNVTEWETPLAEFRLEKYVFPMVLAIIFIVGIVGNGTVILIFLRNSSMRNVPNTYILSLALGDLLVIISTVPFTSIVYTLPSWPFGETICKVTEGAKDVSIGVSVFTLTALSGDRFFAIVDPMRALTSGGGGGARMTLTTNITALSIWVFSLICALPAATFSHILDVSEDGHPPLSVCWPFPGGKTNRAYQVTNVIVKLVVYYAIPLLISGCFYVLMSRHLVHNSQHIPGEVLGQARQARARRKVAKTALAFVVIFALCFLPIHVYNIWFFTNPNSANEYNAFWHNFRMIALVLAYMNSCVNPITLYIVSGAFRKQFNKYLLCCKRRNGNILEAAPTSTRRALRRPTCKSACDSLTMTPFCTNVQQTPYSQ